MIVAFYPEQRLPTECSYSVPGRVCFVYRSLRAMERWDPGRLNWYLGAADSTKVGKDPIIRKLSRFLGYTNSGRFSRPCR